IGGLTVTHPVLGWGLALGVVAIAGLPPLGIFMSEFLVVFDFRPRPAACDYSGLRPARGARRAVFAVPPHRPRGTARAEGLNAGLLCADVRSSGACLCRRHLHAAGAGRLVPERRRIVRLAGVAAR